MIPNGGLWGQVFNLAILLHQILSLMVLPCNIIYRLRKLASRVKTCPPIPTPLRVAFFHAKLNTSMEIDFTGFASPCTICRIRSVVSRLNVSSPQRTQTTAGIRSTRTRLLNGVQYMNFVFVSNFDIHIYSIKY